MPWLAIVSLLAALLGCRGEKVEPAAAPPTCPAAPAASTSTATGWIGWLGVHSNDVSVVIDDGRGGKVTHRADQPAPLASASKVLHLAAYAQAVAERRVRPEDPVPVADWEAWYLPGTDGGAHQKALEHLAVPQNAGRARDPNRTVRLDDLVAVMIRFSDNAVPELLRDQLGDAALRKAGQAGGWKNPDLPSFLGQAIALLAPALVTGTDRAARGSAEWALARRYTTDSAFRTGISRRPLPGPAPQLQWAERTAAGSAAQLSGLHRAISTGSFGGADVARRHLEWQPPPGGAGGLGFKGGSLPGVVTEAITLRRTDGTTGSAVVLARRIAVDDWQDATSSFAHQKLLIAALNQPDTVNQIRCAL